MALLILRESNNTTRYTSKLPNPRHRPCFATPRSGHITTPRPNSSLARQWGNITMPHPGNTPGQHPGTAAERYPGAASSQPRPAPDPPPLRIGPTTSQHCLGALPGARNKKSVRIAAFLRLAIVASSPIANRGTKTQQKWHIPRLKEPRRAPNRKKVAKIPSFLFFVMDPIAATGKISRKRAEHHDQQPKIRNKKGARHADASKKPNRL